MTWLTSSEQRRRRWVAAVVLLVIGVGCLVVGLRGRQDPVAGRVAGPVAGPAGVALPSAASGTAPVRSRVVRPVVTRSEPVALRIPAIGLSVSVSTLGLKPDGTVQVPTDFQEPGWFRLGPTPGQLGSAVILGHVDSYRGPAVFFRLRSLRAGDRVEVILADGVVVRFVVTKVAMYLKEHFPARLVYGSHGFSALQLVTCGGEFDTRTRSYRSNLVAYTSLAATTPATRSR